jgi:hypothetical protein
MVRFRIQYNHVYIIIFCLVGYARLVGTEARGDDVSGSAIATAAAADADGHGQDVRRTPF